MAADWFDGAGNGAAVDVSAVLDDLGIAGVQQLVQLGALVSLGTTSDGGALGLTVTVDGRWRREYFRDAESLVAWIAEAVPAVADARGADRPPAASASRQRRRAGR